jgi:hypothetical protein
VSERERGKAPTTSQLCKPNAIYRGIEQNAVKTKKKKKYPRNDANEMMKRSSVTGG